MNFDCFDVYIASAAKDAGLGIKDITQLIIGLVAISTLCYTILQNSRASIKEARAKEREQIGDLLNNFFAPLKVLQSESRRLYKVFKNGLPESARINGEFRTVKYLANGYKLDSESRVLLEEILKIGKAMLELTETKGSAYVSSNFSELLGKFGAHERCIRILLENGRERPTSAFDQSVFPLELYGALESEMRRLQQRYDSQLDGRKKSRCSFGSIKKFFEGGRFGTTPKTIRFYNDHSKEYYKKTFDADLTEAYDAFLSLVPYGGLILDAGCGVGRDTVYFIKRGYRVVSFDASEKMVEVCNSYPHAFCLHQSFQEIKYVEEYDGVWACASLLHVCQTNIKPSLDSLLRSLKSGGYLYISVKVIEKDFIDEDGRHFYRYTKEYFDEHLKNRAVHVDKKLEDNRNSDGVSFLNLIYQKIDMRTSKPD